jgi:hypothetical protein
VIAGPRERGTSFTELVVAMAICFATTGLSVPLVANAVDAARARHAAGVVASRFRLARQQAIARSAFVAIVFDDAPSGWQMSVCVDGNGNGVRRAEIDAGTDSCPEGPQGLEALTSGVRVARDASIRGPDGDPPSADPVRFGRTDLLSFSPLGSCTGGSLFLRSRDGRQYAVRVAGATARIRILKYDERTAAWLVG